MNVLETRYVPLVRLKVVKERFLPYGSEEMVNPERLVRMVKRLLEGVDKECMLAIPVDAMSKPLGVEFVAMGAVNCVYAFAREIFKHALVSNASGLVLIRNRPSGDILPSEQDWNFTREIQEAGDLLGVELYDHIIIGENDNYFSMGKTHKWEFREKYVCREKEAC